jgi:NADH-quinone oxidoreductase subunit L
MQGPTPVSALIHAATMVTAGVYMTARLHFLFSLAPATLALIAAIGTLTAVLAATIALVQNDIKRVLAYSTVSQLGYMFLAVGVGAFSAAVFHLFTHAFFKACLFLGAGSVIHGLHGEQDMRKMGGLRSHFPITYWTYLIAALALSGAPLTAGFFSKDQILWQAYASPLGSVWLWFFAWLTAGLTAFYMFRQFFLIFHGRSNVDEKIRPHIHESPPVMTVPVVILAAGSVFAGWLGTPEFMGGSVWNRWLQPAFGAQEGHHGSVTEELFLALLTVAIGALGFALAYLAYGRGWKLLQRLSSGALYRLLLHKYYVDELYDRLFVTPLTRIAEWLAGVFDPGFVDGAVNGVADRVRELSRYGRLIQTGNVQHYVLGFLTGTLLVLAYYLYR